ncbi:MAG: DUF885 domain-containing protein, partial [Candidatus Nealsonbacteria bacterium]|nr:DUF885 domain-containing protein [Candidatus Nealsonbacteria bacterium]
MSLLSATVTLAVLTTCQAASPESPADRRFDALVQRYVDEAPAMAPVSATLLGDHRFDGELDQVNTASRARETAFCQECLAKLADVDREKLSRANQVDYAMLEHHLRARLWQLKELQQWAWDPLIYTELAGTSIYALTARNFAPLDQRLARVADRLEQFPRLLEQVRATLNPKRVPKIHAETAIKQNRGALAVMDNMVKPHLEELPADERTRLTKAMATARSAIERHQQWLESELLPRAAGNFRIGAERFDEKLAFTLQTPTTRRQIRDRAEAQLRNVRNQMYAIAKEVYRKQYPLTDFPGSAAGSGDAVPSDAYKQSIIRACLELAYAEMPPRDKIVETAQQSLALATAFVREKDLVTVPPDPVDIILMPEFRRGVSIAYCDSPGPLDVGQKTFYAVAPLPEDWTAEQVHSFLREYNVRSLHNLTIHEAMPGHFLQIAHANRYPGKLRALLASGVFIEGWAVYSEMMMCDEGFLD